jgi:hypothetical protein
MIAELWILIKLLFQTKPSSILEKEDLDLIVMKNFPFKGYRFMSWCGKIILRQDRLDFVKEHLKTKEGKISITHEKGHAIQAESEHGDNWIRYYLSYFWNWIKHNPVLSPSSACYFFNRYEVEAFAQEENPDYWKNYNRKNLRTKYKIKKPRKIWRKLGSNEEAWKKWVKTL